MTKLLSFTKVRFFQMDNYRMRTYQDIREAFGNVLASKMAKLTAMQMQAYPDWFVETYQSKTNTRLAETVTIGHVLDAIHRSEDYFRQYPVDRKVVRETAASIFVNDGWLKKLPALAELDGEEDDHFFIIGGRHRGYAIVAALAQLCHINTKDDVDAEEMFELMLQCNIKVDLVQVPDKETLVQLIKADNDSRTMRGAELAHIRTQMLGLGANNVDDIAYEVVGNENLKPKEIVSMVAQTFTRRAHRKLKPQTLQVIGEKVAAFAVYGAVPGTRLSRKDSPVNSPAQVDAMMKRAYDIMCDIVHDMEVVARNANDITERIIDLLERNDIYVPATEAEHLEEVVPAKKQRATRRKEVGSLTAIAERAALELSGDLDAIF